MLSMCLACMGQAGARLYHGASEDVEWVGGGAYARSHKLVVISLHDTRMTDC